MVPPRLSQRVNQLESCTNESQWLYLDRRILTEESTRAKTSTWKRSASQTQNIVLSGVGGVKQGMRLRLPLSASVKTTRRKLHTTHKDLSCNVGLKNGLTSTEVNSVLFSLCYISVVSNHGLKQTIVLFILKEQMKSEGGQTTGEMHLLMNSEWFYEHLKSMPSTQA